MPNMNAPGQLALSNQVGATQLGVPASPTMAQKIGGGIQQGIPSSTTLSDPLAGRTMDFKNPITPRRPKFGKRFGTALGQVMQQPQQSRFSRGQDGMMTFNP